MKGAECGDRDPLDICVVSERPINRSEVILNARVVGGLPMNDNGEADDKIIAVLDNDPVLAQITDIHQLPEPLVDRLRHYFLTYKFVPGEKQTKVSIKGVYGREQAEKVIEAAMKDYDEAYGAG
jgi:inorganic pyrophosphatase